MKYRYLNEVLLNWNSEEIQDNSIIKSNDIKKEIDQYFIYRVDDKSSRIRIFNVDDSRVWSEYEKYRDKVYINGKHVELIDGKTIDKFNPGEYRVYIEDIDQVEDTKHMFYDCQQLIKAYIPNSVMSIGISAFSLCSGLTSVSIPNSVTSIRNYAFSGCSGLTSVTIGNSVTSIGEDAFCDCTSLASVTIPNSVTSIGICAFQNCSSLTSVTIGNSVTQIDKYAFVSCISLTSVTIGNSVTSIGNSAFRDCSGLTSVTIPNSVTSIARWAFHNCKNIQTVYVEDINKFKQIDFGNEYANPTYYGAKLIELQNYEI